MLYFPNHDSVPDMNKLQYFVRLITDPICNYVHDEISVSTTLF